MKLQISDLNSDREWSAATGRTKTQFEKLLLLFTASYLELYEQSVAKRQAEIEMTPCLSSEEELLFFTLFSLKVGLTYDVLSIVSGIESEAKDAFGRIAVIFEFQFFDGSLPLANYKSPSESYRQQSREPFGFIQVRLFQVEATRFQSSKQGLNTPSFLVVLAAPASILAKPESDIRPIPGNNRSSTIKHWMNWLQVLKIEPSPVMIGV